MHFGTLFAKPVTYNVRRQSYFCRQGINVSEACSINPSRFVCLIVVEKGELATMLSAAENPSHTKFSVTDALRNDYAFGTFQTIRFLQLAPQAIARLIGDRDRETDVGLFADVFWKTAKRKTISPKPKPKKGEQTGPLPPDPRLYLESHPTI